MREPRSQFGAAAYGGFIYAVGGFAGGTSSNNTVEYAPIRSDGKLGAWKSAPPIHGARCEHAVVAEAGYLYVLGGYECGGGALDDVQFAPIHRDGSLGAWKATRSFKTARSGLGAIAYRKHLYVIGGDVPGTGTLDDVQVAAIESDGSLGAWQTTTPFHDARSDHGVAVWNGRLYVIGGATTVVSDVANGGKMYGSHHFDDVQVATIGADGLLGAWQATTPLPTAVNGEAVVAAGDRLFVLGGNAVTSYVDVVQTAPIQRDGTVGEWSEAPPFANGRMSLAAVAYGGYLYMLGGNTDTVEYLSDVQVAPLGLLK